MASPPTGRKNGRKGGNNGQNIKVFVRCRPLNTAEKNSRSYSCVETTNREITVKERPLDKFTKTFSFDRVFGPESKQIDVYKAVAKNSVEEVLNGFNCTIFAYGQTGTGKTFTMEGERTPDNTSWDDDPLAGIIPRCVNHLFDELRIQKLEFTMRVSFLELYNEELFDLLSPHDDMSKLRLYEDASRKGSCIIQGLEEVLVRSKANVYEVLEKGSNKRQTAATLMNAHSSRSHTVFTVTLHIKENTVDGDELLKTGKLHLVDLAGSENIGRSGAVDKRAREAGNINMSLLTLGRVITALVEKTPHIPYRESKLTRLLQDALGGRTKTSIIATVSPATINLEETLSTLDYAHRAKNIQNKPEVNQKLNKKELIGEYSQEIERLRLDLMAMREKSGVYLANENYQEMLQTMETQAQEITEKINYIRSLEEGIEVKTNELDASNAELEKLAASLETMKTTLQETTEVLGCTQKLLHQTSVECEEQKYLVSAHVKTEDKLVNQGKALVSLADTTTNHLTKLQDKLDRKKNVEKLNLEVSSEFKNSYSVSVDKFKDEISKSVDQQKEVLGSMSTQLGDCVSQCKEEMSSVFSQSRKMCESHVQMFNEIHCQYKSEVEQQLSSTQSFVVGKTEMCQNQVEHLKNFEKTIFLPAIEKIATLISAQATMMSALHSTVNGKLSNLNVKVEDFVNQQVDLVTNQESKVQTLLDTLSSNTSACQTTFEYLCKSVDTKVQVLESKSKEMEAMSKEMEAMISSVRDIKQGIETDLADSKDTLLSNLGNLDETTKSAKGQVKSFAASHKDSYVDHMSAVKTSVSDIQATAEEYNNKSEENVQHLGEERCGLESMISQHVAETNEYLREVTADLNIYKKNAEKSAEKSIQENATSVKRGVDILQCDQETLLKMLEKEYARLEEDLLLVKNKCHLVTTNIQKQVEFQDEELTSQKTQLLELFSERMVQDIPTGQTPVRQDYKFSRILSTTSPHDRLLERHRASGLTAMSRIPLPAYGDDTEDELSSPSIDTSRNSASDSSHVEEDANEAKLVSGFGSTTDLGLTSATSKNVKEVFAVPSRPVPASRENSSISLSRSSSTSSIPEIKDKENSNSQRGSSKKRGIKQPNTYSSNASEKTAVQENHPRTRRVLGMHN